MNYKLIMRISLVIALVTAGTTGAANLFSRFAVHTRNNLRFYRYGIAAGAGTLSWALYNQKSVAQAQAQESELHREGVLENMSEDQRRRSLLGISYLHEKGVLSAISGKFAQQQRNGLGIQLGVEEKLYDISETRAGAVLKNPSAMYATSLNLVDGLKKCASSSKQK